MNDAALNIPRGMKYIQLPVEDGFIELEHGSLIEMVDNDRLGRPRWAEIRLYKYIDADPGHNDGLPEDDDDFAMFGKQRYLIYTVGHTVVYHQLDSECNKGVPLTAADFPGLASGDCEIRTEHPSDLEPCERCRPAAWQDVPGETAFEIEVTWFKYFKCKTGDDVLLALRKDPKCRHCWHRPHEHRSCWCRCESYEEGPRPLSVPGRRLVEKARRKDPEIARAAARKIRL